jgi:hypothetical protein
MCKELSSEADLQLALRVCTYTVLYYGVERNTMVAFDSHTHTHRLKETENLMVIIDRF